MNVKKAGDNKREFTDILKGICSCLDKAECTVCSFNVEIKKGYEKYASNAGTPPVLVANGVRDFYINVSLHDPDWMGES